ncbi:S8 family serine peptidase [Vibrio sp. Of7-15]|uniref:S8 family serine peptidase n=1 Tax=Vibrio sp. Of7-15 TaxID=2724879 RepID=UPI001EF219A3|nr:S8 family serine peptidase [Vibrio sp. Of7-15]MCG7497172.1 S8 family serine peptidase [Vibrio sp. Of7-15]
MWSFKHSGSPLILSCCLGFSSSLLAAEIPNKLNLAAPTKAITHQYLVAFQPRPLSYAGTESEYLDSLIDSHQLSVLKRYPQSLNGVLIEATPKQAQQLAQSEHIQYIQQNQTFALSPVISMSSTQVNPEWGLDRIDERFLPTDNSYTSDRDGTGVTVYVLDTGIRMSHSEFNSRATSGWDFVGNDANASDCHGHGTHVAGIIGGVAKNVNLVGVRIINCDGATSSDLIVSGLEWVLNNATSPAIVNMSFGGVTSDLAIDNAVNALIQNNISAVAAAGNNNSDACNETPARVPNAITVGSTTSSDVRSGFSNKGSCLDIFAPGTDIKSAWKNSNSSHSIMSGTSMSAAFVSGTLALGLQTKPTVSPSVARNSLVDAATLGELSSTGSGSPNKLLFTDVLIDYPSTTTKWDDFGNNDRWDAQLVGDFDGDGKDDLANFDPLYAKWWVSRSTGNAFTTTHWETNDTSHDITSFHVGDFNGDGKDDIAYVESTNYNIWVGLSTGSSFETTLWKNLGSQGGSGWQTSLLGDFNGDGKDDFAHMSLEDGDWWVTLSNGNTFDMTKWGRTSDLTRWTYHLAGDFTGDGKDDVAHFDNEQGGWYVSVSSGSSFSATRWDNFSDFSGLTARLVGDFNADGKDDIANFNSDDATWWVSLSNGSQFTTTKWVDYHHEDGWKTHIVGDFNGDGESDIANYRTTTGKWGMCESLPQQDDFSTYVLSDYNNNSGWTTQVAGDFTGNGKDDIANFNPNNGTWWVTSSH